MATILEKWRTSLPSEAAGKGSGKFGGAQKKLLEALGTLFLMSGSANALVLASGNAKALVFAFGSAKALFFTSGSTKALFLASGKH